ncbi:MAG: biotin/lipoyl-binding protein [Desulfatibacillaceae bacterium]|nr:biotin/lipoyl-binding protein [Desulfatibacillaceae bacterium]
MEYPLNINGKDFLVELEDKGENLCQVQVDGRQMQVRWLAAGNGLIFAQVQENGKTRSLKIHAAKQGEAFEIFIDGLARTVTDAKLSRRKAAGSAQAQDTITPSIPSTVSRIVVEKGQIVEKGQPVIVLSAMKMETTLCAPYSGEVTAVNVNPGDRVGPGQILVEIEKASTS